MYYNKFEKLIKAYADLLKSPNGIFISILIFGVLFIFSDSISALGHVFTQIVKLVRIAAIISFIYAVFCFLSRKMR